MRYPQPPYNNVLVKVEGRNKDIIKHGSLELETAGIEYNEDLKVYAQTKGHCVNVPRGMFGGFFPFISQDVRIGDEVVLHYNSINEEMCVDEQQQLYLVPYDYIFAIIREGQIVMIGGRVLCEPIYDGTEEDGMVVKKTDSGIIKEINVGHDLKKATLTHIGTPMLDQKPVDVKAGDTVWYDKDADFENVINGKTYFVMIQEDLLMCQPN